MDVLRAQEISESPVMADVTYDGTPIYIQHVYEESNTARIYSLDDPDQELTVPLYHLEEH
ncbi:H-type small acid-soluble spore protein [Salibacterium aidingense]|uniref:H-type small acid-soluble spore protein n=1 Tax=Salibacterium aidingense TaxID=384933 RepID=UPI000412F874|nr:H-type small acid-soluble spore protein [Salibacterium aidingense]